MDWALYLRFVLALLFVLGLIGGLAYGIRRLGLFDRFMGSPAGAARRLRVLESLALDARRRLVLVQHDEAEHLILIGGGNDLLVESGTAVQDLKSDRRPPHGTAVEPCKPSERVG
ncbi:MAG: flagellar biosynthetic protein FliO [Alphaproteobacteria bacterium]|nr:flagellar biosynthetic protein FliO [Alphaproteobacteria bacterium]